MIPNKKHISLFFLAIFAFVKFVGLHEFAHSEEELFEDCELCEYVVTSNKVSFVANESFVFEQVILLNLIEELPYEYSYQFTNNQIDNSLFCRPPPVV